MNLWAGILKFFLQGEKEWREAKSSNHCRKAATISCSLVLFMTWVVFLFHKYYSHINVRGFAFLVMIKKRPCLMATGIVYAHRKGPGLRRGYQAGW